MDKIMVKGAKFDVHIGVTEEERKTKQPILMDLTLFFDIADAASQDDIEKTINYSLVCKRVSAVLAAKEYKLLETAAEAAAQDILNLFGAKKVEICIKKPNALRIADYTAVEIVREK